MDESLMLAVGEQLKRREAAFMARCREAGLKVTPQRLEVFREVAATTSHPDAETVLAGVRERLPTVAVDTIYRTLRTLVDLGVLNEVSTVGSRARFDADVSEHHHFICTRCGRVQDIALEARMQVALPADVARLGEVTGLELQVRGICRSCRPAVNVSSQPRSSTPKSNP